MITPETRRAVFRARALRSLASSNTSSLVDHPAFTREERFFGHHALMLMAACYFVGAEDAPPTQMTQFQIEMEKAHSKLDELCDWWREGDG